jgi:hypothetical protein
MIVPNVTFFILQNVSITPSRLSWQSRNDGHVIGARSLGLRIGWVKLKTIKLVFVASPLIISTQHYGEGAKTGWIGIRIM